MTGWAFDLVRPLLFMLDAEQAHGLTLRALRWGLGGTGGHESAALTQTLWGLDFPNPLGLAAGFDKNADVPDAMLRLGLGFTECGTVTPRPQAGNPRPRIFRLREDEAVINRLGFNNGGLAVARERLAARRGRPGLVGANLGANKDSADKAADYVLCLEALYLLADYFTINVSSPNTPGLRGLQNRAELEDLLGRLMAARAALAGGATAKPLLLKVAPDLGEGQADEIAAVCLAHHVDGLIVSNTTVARPDHLRGSARGEMGGLSGAPLFAASTEVLATFYQATQGRLPLVGVGGVASGVQAYEKILKGASLVQLYTGLVYGGPGLITQILMDLEMLLGRDGFGHVSEAVGAAHRGFVSLALAEAA